MDKGTFTPADVVVDFDATWLDETLCRSWVLLRLHHQGAVCPKCGSGLRKAQRLSFYNMKRVRCYTCGKFYTAMTGTFLCGTKLDFRQIVLMNYLIGIGLDDADVAKAVGLKDQSTVWKYRKKVSELCQQHQ